jgi:membrane protein
MLDGGRAGVERNRTAGWSMRAFAETLRRWVRRLIDLAYRILDTVPPVRRTVDEVVRVELIDRSMVIAAQALFALIPLVVVLITLMPDWATDAAVERFEDVTGLAAARQSLLDSADENGSSVAVTSSVGFVGVLITVISASSFARALMRAYERVWDLPYLAGVRGRVRRLWWLLGWLTGLALVALASAAFGHPDHPLLAPLKMAVQMVLATAVWWWTLYVLLSGRVAWQRLWLAALLTGVAIVLYVGGSTLVMPTYAVSSVQQFGGFGLVLAIATWLIGGSVVLVAAAILGHVLVEDRWTREVLVGAVSIVARYVLGTAHGLRAGPRTRSGRGG